MPSRYDAFITRIHEIHHLGRAAGLLGWDQEVCMPPKGVTARAQQKATLAAVIHHKVCDEALGDLIAELAGATLDQEAAANVREVKRERDRAVKIPASLVREISETTTLAQQAWVQAKQQDNWPHFAPHLEKLVALKKQEAEAVGYEGEPYNALLDEYEPGARVELLTPLFEQLRADLSDLLAEIGSSAVANDDAVLRQSFPIALQEQFGREILGDMGYDFEAGRLDASAHPFTQGLGVHDVRITTRYEDRNLATALYANLHEGGHALYEQGFAVEHEGTPMAEAVSLGIHESQSRMWENCVGRSRDFLAHYLPRLQALFPDQLGATGVDDIYRAVNCVKPSLIRIEADEVTYNLHIILRLELERALVAGDAAVADVPELWKSRMKKYLGVEPPNDAQGALQDIHWAFGVFGYFPTYTLGNLYAAQLFDTALRRQPDLPERFSRGEFQPLLDWLRQAVHRKGSLLQADDLCREVTGRDLSPEPFLGYLRRKFGEIYNLS